MGVWQTARGFIRSFAFWVLSLDYSGISVELCGSGGRGFSPAEFESGVFTCNSGVLRVSIFFLNSKL